MSARSSLASTLRQQGEFAQAAVLQKEVLEAFRSTGQLSTEKGIRAISGLAISTIQAGDAQASLGYFQEALDLSRAVPGRQSSPDSGCNQQHGSNPSGNRAT